MISEKITRVSGFLLVCFPLTLLLGPAVADALAIVIGLGFLLHSGLTRDWQWLRAPWVRAALALYLYLLLRSLFAESPAVALSRAAPWIRYALFAAAVTFWLYSIPNVRRFLPWMLTAAASFLLFDMLFQYALGFDLFGRPGIVSDGGSLRLTGPYSAPRAGITLVWIVWPAVAFLFSLPRYRLAAALMWGLALIAIFLSGERMATLLALLASLLLVIFLRDARRAAFWMAPLAGLALAGLMALNPSIGVRQVDSTVTAAHQAAHSPYGRIWVSTVKMIVDYPVFGVGAKHYRSVCLQAPYGNGEPLNCNLHPHHLYLEWWVEEGAVGLGLFAWLIVCWGREIAGAFTRCREQSLFIGLVIGLVVKLFPFSTAISFFAAWSVLPFWLMLGWLMAWCKEEYLPSRAETDTP